MEFRRYSAWLPTYGDKLSLIASGPNTDEWNWTREFLEELLRKGRGELERIYGMALHHYAWNLSRGKTQDWNAGKGDALNFDAVDWYELLREGQRMEGLVTGHWQVLSEFDREHRVKLVVDEWGPWYRPGSEATPGDLLEQMPTLRDAVFSGMTMDIFNRNPDKIAMANCAQLVNCLNSLYLAHEDKFCNYAGRARIRTICGPSRRQRAADDLLFASAALRSRRKRCDILGIARIGFGPRQRVDHHRGKSQRYGIASGGNLTTRRLREGRHHHLDQQFQHSCAQHLR